MAKKKSAKKPVAKTVVVEAPKHPWTDYFNFKRLLAEAEDAGYKKAAFDHENNMRDYVKLQDELKILREFKAGVLALPRRPGVGAVASAGTGYVKPSGGKKAKGGRRR